MLGVVLFVIGLSVWPIADRLRESEALVRRQEIDLANLEQLSHYIVQHLRESILVVDTEDRIRLINESAAGLLGAAQAFPGALLGEASPRLLYLLETWRQRTEAMNSERRDPGQRATARACCGRTSRRWATPAGRGAGVPGGHEPDRREGAAAEARRPRAPQRQHRPRDPQSGRRHEPCRAAAGRIPAAGAGGSAAHRHHHQERRTRQRHHQQCAAAVAARGHAGGDLRAGQLDRGFPRRVLRNHAVAAGPPGERQCRDQRRLAHRVVSGAGRAR